jgi:hypothetical protein
MINIIGDRYGRLVVLEEVSRVKYLRRYSCVCDCGRIIIAYQCNLRAGKSQSCGCLRDENVSKLFSSGENEIIIYSDYAELIILDCHGEEKARAILDLDDIEKVRGYRWYLSTQGYAVAKNKHNNRRNLAMHRLIYPYGVMGDHVDRNRLNNRKANLREANSQENCMNQGIRSTNTSGFRGIYWDKSREKWSADIMYSGKKYHLGRFTLKEDAISARIKAEKELFGKFSTV